MTSPPPLIQGNILTYSQSGQPAQLLMDTLDWYAWLETASTFTFQSEHGTFTARKERAGSKRGGEYWKAYSRRHGKLYRVYLGKSEDITFEQLHSVAAVLANKVATNELFDVLDLTRKGRQSSLASSRQKAQTRRVIETASSYQTDLTTHWLASLPVPLTNLIGREQEVRAICDLLSHRQVRLLTITGTGGVGKTRLALEVARVLHTTFTDGICFVSLTQQASVHLFVQRTQAIQPAFQVTAANARTIAEICIQLDGLPLAIELAAARGKLLPPQALLKRLSHRLDVLTGGAQDLPTRQRTLRNTLQWSYDLLADEEQRLFRWLSIFMGGFTLEAAEAMCQASGTYTLSVFEGIASLLDKNIVQRMEREGEEPRLFMLETIREFGLDCLVRQGELNAAQREHARYYLSLVESAEMHLFSSEQLIWLDRLEWELDNLRAILQAGLTGSVEEREVALRLGAALRIFWAGRGHLREGRNVLEQLLAGAGTIDIPVRLKALNTLGMLLWSQNDMRALEAVAEEALATARMWGDQEQMTVALILCGMAMMQDKRNYSRAQAYLEEALASARTLEDRYLLFHVLACLGLLAGSQHDAPRAIALFEEGLTQCRAVGERLLMSIVLTALARVELRLGHTDSARLSAEVGERHNLAYSRLLLANLAMVRGEFGSARQWYEEGLATSLDIELTSYIASGLKGLGCVAAAQGLPRWAALLWGTAETLRESHSVAIPQALYDRMVAMVRRQLGEKAFKEALARGCAMTAAQVLSSQEAFEPQIVQRLPYAQAASVPSLAGLTAREREVLHLVAQGLTDAQVAEQLVISTRTVNTHLTSIYGKIGVSSRSAATRYAIEQHIT